MLHAMLFQIVNYQLRWSSGSHALVDVTSLNQLVRPRGICALSMCNTRKNNIEFSNAMKGCGLGSIARCARNMPKAL